MNAALKANYVRAPIFLAALIQMVAFYVSWHLASGHLALAIALQSASAGVLTMLARLPRWWIALQIGFPLCTALALWAQIASWIYLAALLTLILVYGNLFSSRVPLYLSNAKTLEALDHWLKACGATHFVDLGCGTGRVLHYLAGRHPAVFFEGVERALLPLAFGALKSRRQKNVRFHARDLWRTDLRSADVVYAFLSPLVMQQLWLHACAQMRPGSFLVSRAFEVPGVPASQVLAAGDASIYVWRIPERP